MENNKKKNKKLSYIIALLVIILFAVTTPKTIQDYGKSNSNFYKVNNYLVFSTCSASYQGGTVWKVNYIGVLGMTFEIRN